MGRFGKMKQMLVSMSNAIRLCGRFANLSLKLGLTNCCIGCFKYFMPRLFSCTPFVFSSTASVLALIVSVSSSGALSTPSAAAPPQRKPTVEWLASKDSAWQPVPEVAARTIELTMSTDKVQVDGKLGEQAWSTAAEAGRFSDAKGPGEEALDWAEVKFVATEEGLVVGARLQAPPSGPLASITANGGRVWRDHALQIELAPAAGRDAIKVIVNAKGVYYAERGTQVWPGTVVSSASLDGPSAWQAEILLPWKDLGLSPAGGRMIPVQLRYLLPEGAGSLSLVPAEKPREWPRLLLSAGEKKENEEVSLDEFYFPGSSSGGEMRVGARWSGGQKGTRITLSVSDRSGTEPVVVKEETFEVEGGKQEAVMTVPAGEEAPCRYSFTISQQASSGNPLELFSQQQLVFPRSRLEWQVDRESLWAGDAEVGGRVFHTPAAGSADSSELTLALWDATHRLAEATVKASDLAVLPFKVTTAGLAAGDYRLVLSDKSGAELVKDLSFGLAMPLPAKSKIALPVDWPEAARAVKSWPVYCGVSFPGGTLMDERLVRVVDQSGKEIPCQADVLARWGPGGSIKWIGLSFNGAPGQSYFAEFGSGVKRSASESTKVTVKETAEAILIDTGAARFELPSKGPLLGKAWLGNRLAVENTGGVLTVKDQKDNEGSEVGGGIDEAPRIEVAGPQRIIVRREGFLRDAQGKEMGRYIVRLTFSAGQTVVPMQHTFVMTRNSNQMQIKELAVRLRPAFAAPWQAAFDVAGDDGKAGWEVVQNVAANEEVWLFQEVFPHHRRTASRFSLGRGAQKLKEGAVAGESAAVWSGECGVGITVPNLARLFPKEISVSSAGLAAKLWSDRGGRLLDYRPGAIADHVGDEWLDKSYPGGSKAFRSQNPGDAAGTGRTHDLAIFLTPGGGNALAGAQAAGEAAAQPPFLSQDPAWLHETKAMGPLQPYDPEQFPRQEAFLKQFFEYCLIGQAERFGDHGFLDYGAGPHTWSSSADPGAGKDWPRLNYRYSNMDYGMRTSSWLAYARSGQRNYRAYADAISRHFYDFKFSHWELPRKPSGAELNGLTSEESMLYWTGVPGRVPAAGGHQAFDVLNHLYQFYLTGDRRALDVTLNFGQYLRRAFDPAVLPDIGATSGNFRAYGCAAILYAQTWDPAYVRLVQEARARLVDLRTTTGLVNQSYYGAYYKHSARGWGVLQDYRATGDSVAGKAILKMSDYLVQGEPTHTAGYHDHDASFFQVAYDLSKDQRFADWINTRINRLAFAYTTADGKLRGLPLEGGNHTANVLEVVAYGLDLVNRTRADIRPRPLFSQLARARDAWLAIEKPESRDVAMEMTAGRSANLSMLSIADASRRDWFGNYTGVFFFDWSPLVPGLAFPGLTSGYGKALLPSEMLGGLYRLDGIESLISHNRGGRVALVAPHGLYYDAAQVDAAPLWFNIPAGTTGTVTVNRPASLEIDGKKIELPAGKPVALPGSAADQAAALTTQAGTIYVRLGGDIPPVFARDRRDLFLPPQAGKPAPLPAPDAGAGLFAAGSGGGASDRAFRLKTEGLQFPRGAQTGDGSFQYFDTRRGTLEFWFKPAWSSALLPTPRKIPMLQTSQWYLALQAAQSEFMSTGKTELMALAGSNVEWTIEPQPPARVPQRLVLPFDFWQDRWYHIAMSWDTRPEVGWVSELYIDGQPALFWNRTGVMSRFRSGLKGEILTDWKPSDPGELFLLPAGLDGWVDQIRVSNVPRYEAPFTPPPAGSLQPDKDTLLYLPLDGTLDGVAQPGVPAPKASTRK